MSTYFISDLHLKPERPDISRALLFFLQQIQHDADALYMLGDIFEAWIGDDGPRQGLEPLLQALKQLSARGCKLYFQHGNRDFLVGQDFACEIGAELLPEYVVVTLPIGPTLLLHGDQLCTDDTEYMAFRSLVRSDSWQQEFLAKPVQERLEIARQLRQASKERGAAKAEYITDVNPQAVADTLLKHDVLQMIHGHTHRPDIHQLTLPDGSPATRIVLGDWDRMGWYLQVNDEGHSLNSFPIEA